MLNAFLSRFSSQAYKGSAETMRILKRNNNMSEKTVWEVDGKSYECFFE